MASSRAEQSAPWSLDLPGILPLVIVAATWELLLKRIIGLAASVARGAQLTAFLDTLTTVGGFAVNVALLLALVLFAEAMLALVRRPDFGPIPHRVTLSGFALALVAISLVGSFVPISADTALLAHAAAVLLSLLLGVGLVWQEVPRRLLVAMLLLLLPTLLRFYASCAISIPMLRTEGDAPLYAFRAGEVIAVIAALASPWLVAGLTGRDLIKRPPLVGIGLSAMPMMALFMALATQREQVRELCLLSLGFELIIPPVIVVYPLALFAVFLSITLLVMPGVGQVRSLAEQRTGYGMALLFIAGLDDLRGTVFALGADPGDTPELIHFLLEGHWEHLNPSHRAMVGPPLRDLYQLVILALGYLLIVRGATDQRRPPANDDRTSTSDEERSRE